jgi:hypothetical protein
MTHVIAGGQVLDDGASGNYPLSRSYRDNGPARPAAQWKERGFICHDLAGALARCTSPCRIQSEVPLKENVAYLFPDAVDRSASPDQLRITLSWCGAEPSSRRIMRNRLPSLEGW